MKSTVLAFLIASVFGAQMVCAGTGNTGSASLSKAGQVNVVCSINGLTDPSVFLQISTNKGSDESIRLIKSNKDNVQLEVFAFEGKQISELSIFSHRTNVVAVLGAGQNEKVLKLSADYNLFGGDIKTEGEENWNGFLYLDSSLAEEAGLSSPAKVTCNFSI